MARRHRAQIREIEPDLNFNNKLVGRLINCVMIGGKKSIAEGIVYGMLDFIKEQSQEDPLEVLMRAIDNIKPKVEVKSRRVGGATYQVPVEVPSRRSRTLAVRWLVDFARNRNEYSMSERLANEIMDATKQQGNAYKRKDDIFRMAQANKAFAHYRW